MASVTWSIVGLLAVINIVIGCNDTTYGLIPFCPGKSCLDIYQNNPSSHGVSKQYVIKIGSHLRFVYCDMSLECGGEKGWMRIANINATGGDNCPNGWKKITSPTKACRAHSNSAGCYSTHFATYNIPYNRVCGMVVGIQKGTTDGFLAYSDRKLIDEEYLDGISITYGFPRKHIWSYAAGISESYSRDQTATCPCTLRGGTRAPSFVRDHYYCESGSTLDGMNYGAYYTGDPLWDGKGCTKSNCCAQPNLPWFYRQIPLTANNDIEAQICCDEALSNEGVLVKEIQLYVQ